MDRAHSDFVERQRSIKPNAWKTIRGVITSNRNYGHVCIAVDSTHLANLLAHIVLVTLLDALYSQSIGLR